MPGSNGNSSYEKLFGEYDGTINTDKEFKSFEKTISSDGGKEDLVKVCEEDSKNVVAAFDQTKLEEKVKLARTPDKKNAKNKMKPEVKDAYLVIGKLKEGKVGSFNKLLETAEGEVTLEKAKQDILDKINSNSDWNDLLKQVARNLVEDIFSECNSVEEFEKKSGSQLSAIEKYDDIGDFFKAIPKEIYQQTHGISKATLQFLEKIGKDFDDIKTLCQEWIEQGILKLNDLVDRCKEKGMTVVDITKMVCEWGGNQFASFVSYLRERGEDVTQALMTAWEFVGGEWNKFVEFCGGQVDMLKDFGMVLIEAGKITGKQLIEGLIANTELAKQMCEELIEKGLIKMGEFVDICNEWGEKGKDMLISVLEKSVDLWNSFADYCLENWESMKDMFAKVTMELLNRGKFVLETFVQWCKKSWEVVGEVACGILVGLVKIGKYTVEAITDVLTVTVGLPVMVISKMLLKAGKEIYKDSIAVAKFVSDLSAVLWEKARQLGMSASEFVKDFINKCKELGLMSKAYIENIVKGVWEKMKEFGMTASDFIKVTYEIVKLSLGNARNKTAEFFEKLGLKVEDIAVTLWEVSKGAWKGCVDFVVNSYKDFNAAMNVLINRCKIGLDKIGEAIMQAGAKVVEFINYVKEFGKITFDNISKWCGGKWEKITMFIRVAIEAAGVTWQNLVDWCGGQIDKIAVALREIYGKGKQKIMDFIKFTGKTALEAGKLLLKLGIGTVALVILALKELGNTITDVTKLFVETLVQTGKMAVKALCEALAEAYGMTKEKIVEIGKAVASAVKNASKLVRDWVYQKTKDVKKAIEATKKFISNSVKDIAEWMYDKGIQIHDVCQVICEEFKGNVREIVLGLKEFARDCALNWNEVIAEASAFLTIDV